jgi:hypothetical protein
MFFEELRKTRRNSARKKLFSSHDVNLRPPEHKTEVMLPIGQRQYEILVTDIGICK